MYVKAKKTKLNVAALNSVQEFVLYGQNKSSDLFLYESVYAIVFIQN